MGSKLERAPTADSRNHTLASRASRHPCACWHTLAPGTYPNPVSFRSLRKRILGTERAVPILKRLVKRGGVGAGIPLAMPPLQTRCCLPWRSHVPCRRFIVAFALATWAVGAGGSRDEESGQPEVRILSPAHGSSHCSAGEVSKRHGLSAPDMNCGARWDAGGRFD